MIEEPQQLLIGIPEYIGLFLIGLWAGKKDIFKRVPELLKHIIFYSGARYAFHVFSLVPLSTTL